jgi:uncharacterized protein YecA (UPF0149 family)
MSEINPSPENQSLVSADTQTEPQVGRNEPCPCGSGKKYKRCHGVDAAPKLSAPAPLPTPSPGAAGPGGFDPSKMDPAMMQEMQKALQRLPRGQLAKLQSIMQRAMAGQDVSAEAMAFEKMLPPEFQQMATQMMMAQGMAGAAAAPEKEMDLEEAKRIVAEAAAKGKVDESKAKELLGEDPAAVLEKQKSGIGGFFKKITGK